MIRFIDLRDQDTGYRFAFWDTVTDSFLCRAHEYAWETWADFEGVAEPADRTRLKGLCPDWVFDELGAELL